MDEIRTLLRIAARRIEMGSFLQCVNVALAAVAAVALVLVVADRVGPESFVPWAWVVPGLAAAGVAAALTWWARRRRSEHQVAVAVDERLNLAERLSTALYCQDRADSFAAAAVAEAVAAARQPRAHEAARRHFRVVAPRGWWLGPLVVLGALLVSLLEPLDLFGRDPEPDPADDRSAVRAAASQSVEAVVREIKSNPELSDAMKDLLGELTEQGADPDALRSPDEIKRDAIKKVTEVNRRLDELLSGEKGKSAEALRQALSQLDTPKEGMAREFAEALAKGDFSSARQALEKMLEQLAEGNVPAEAQEQLAEQLQQLANQLQQLAQQQQQLQQALQQAGLDPQLANNPQALQQALKNNPNLNQQQVQQLQQLVQAQQAARQMCQGLGQACQNMAQAMQGNQGQGMGQGLADQLNQMEQLQMMLQQAQAAANACAGMCQGLGQGLSEKPGPGMGNRGVGEGGRAPRAPTPWGTQLRKADVTTDPEGEIIARMLIDGPEYIGESRKAARRIVTELLDGYDQAIAEELVPPQYKSAHQHYFGELKKRTEARLAEDKDAATGQPAAADPAPADAPQTPAPAPAPAEPAKGGA